jgi:enamine deaminase RidA (YjgF/YER057c/UK114 family)
MATIEKLCAGGVYDPPGYSQLIKVTGAKALLFLAGQVPYDTEGRAAHRGDFLAQARNVFGAIKGHVEAAGGTLADVVKITTYVTDVRYGWTSGSCETSSSASAGRPRRCWRSAPCRTPTT